MDFVTDDVSCDFFEIFKSSYSEELGNLPVCECSLKLLVDLGVASM